VGAGAGGACVCHKLCGIEVGRVLESHMHCARVGAAGQRGIQTGVEAAVVGAPMERAVEQDSCRPWEHVGRGGAGTARWSNLERQGKGAKWAVLKETRARHTY